MFHRIIFLLLIVSSLSCNFNHCAVCFQSFMDIACRSIENAARIKRFSRLHIVINHEIKKIINVINFLFLLKSNSINFHCKFGALQMWEPAGRIGDFGHFLNVFAKSPWLIVLNIDWVHLFWKIVKYCILSEVCIINSTVSPQMWCIKSINRLVYTPPDLLARFCKVNMSKPKR